MSPLSSGAVTNPFLYNARELDTETGLNFYRARYYDPATGRFLREDLVNFDVRMNFYLYVANESRVLGRPTWP